MTQERGATAWAITRSAAWIAGGRVAGQVLAVAITIVLARGLGTIGFGQYAFVGAIILIANTVTSFGTESLLIREIAARRTDASQLATSALALQLVLSVGCVIVIVAAAGALPHQRVETIAALRIYALCLFPLAYSSVYSAALRGLERMDLYARQNVGTAGLQLIAALGAVAFHADLCRVLIAQIVAQVGAAVLGWYLCRTAWPGVALPWWRAPWGAATMAASTGWLALLSGVGMLGQRVGVVLLSSLAGDAPAGWFAAAARVVEGLKLGNYAVAGAMLPVASRLTTRALDAPATGSEPALARLLHGSRLVLLVIAVLAAVGVTLFAAPLVMVLYGSAYAPAVTALRILAWTLIPAAAVATVSLALVSAGLERLAVLAYVVALAVTAGLALWWIPRAGLGGACAAVLVGEGVRTVALLLGDRRRVRGFTTPRGADMPFREMDA